MCGLYPEALAEQRTIRSSTHFSAEAWYLLGFDGAPECSTGRHANHALEGIYSILRHRPRQGRCPSLQSVIGRFRHPQGAQGKSLLEFRQKLDQGGARRTNLPPYSLPNPWSAALRAGGSRRPHAHPKLQRTESTPTGRTRRSPAGGRLGRPPPDIREVLPRPAHRKKRLFGFPKTEKPAFWYAGV